MFSKEILNAINNYYLENKENVFGHGKQNTNFPTRIDSLILSEYKMVYIGTIKKNKKK